MFTCRVLLYTHLEIFNCNNGRRYRYFQSYYAFDVFLRLCFIFSAAILLRGRARISCTNIICVPADLILFKRNLNRAYELWFVRFVNIYVIFFSADHTLFNYYLLCKQGEIDIYYVVHIPKTKSREFYSGLFCTKQKQYGIRRVLIGLFVLRDTPNSRSRGKLTYSTSVIPINNNNNSIQIGW